MRTPIDKLTASENYLSPEQNRRPGSSVAGYSVAEPFSSNMLMGFPWGSRITAKCTPPRVSPSWVPAHCGPQLDGLSVVLFHRLNADVVDGPLLGRLTLPHSTADPRPIGRPFYQSVVHGSFLKLPVEELLVELDQSRNVVGRDLEVNDRVCHLCVSSVRIRTVRRPAGSRRGFPSPGRAGAST